MIQKLKEFYKEFTFWDWLVIYSVISLYSQSFALLMVSNMWGAIAWAAFAYIAWQCHIWSVKHEMRTGRRK